MDWTASESATWLSVSPASGTNAGTVTVTPSIAGLAVGTYTTDVTFTAPGATGSPKTVTVTLTVGPQAPSNLVGAWGFDETTGTTAPDASGRGNTGTINGPLRSAGGKFGGALSFDGINDWVTVADADSLDLTTGMTTEGWVRPTAIGTGWRTVMLKEQPSNLIYSLYAGNGKGRAATDLFTTADRGLSGTTATPLNAWTHLAATYDGTTQRLYVNGVQVATKATTGAIKVSTGALRIGGNGTWNDEWFAGLIDEVRVYNRALTATEIQAAYPRPMWSATVPVPVRRVAYRVAHRLLRVYWGVARPHTLGVKCVVREGDAVVFVRHAYGDRRQWELPGGGIKRGEDPRATAAREAREELGLDLADWRELGTVEVRGYGRRTTIQLLRGPVAGAGVTVDAGEIGGAGARWPLSAGPTRHRRPSS